MQEIPLQTPNINLNAKIISRIEITHKMLDIPKRSAIINALFLETFLRSQ